MRTLLSWLSALLLMLQTIPVLAEEHATDKMPPETVTGIRTDEEMDDATCRSELKIPGGRITIGYLLTKYRRCLNRERQAREVQRTVERQQQATDATALSAKPRLEILRRGSRRVLQNQTALRMSQVRSLNLKGGKKTFVRFRRRTTVNEDAGTGSGGVK